MDASTYEKTVRDKFTALFNENTRIESIYKKVKNGSAGYEEAHAFAVEIGNILADVFGKTVDSENLDEMSLKVVENILGQNVRLSSVVCESVQLNLNEAAEINIAPVEPSKARTQSKVKGIMTNLEETGSVEKLKQSAKTLTLSTVDEWVQTNADFQAKAGLSPVIVRKWDGTWGSHDTRHTDYCSKLQGTYEYYGGVQGNFAYGSKYNRQKTNFSGWDGPKDLFKRHEGCQCVISYYPNEKAQGRITALAKGEKDTDKQLWNTGRVFSTSRSAELRRRRREYGKEEARKILNEEWKGGLNGNAERHFKVATGKSATLSVNNVDRLMSNYESYRKKFLNNAVAITEKTKDKLRHLFEADLPHIEKDFSEKMHKTIGKLNDEFYSPLSKITELKSTEAIGSTVFARTRHEWESGMASIAFNPLKVNAKGIKRLRELSDDGYSILFASGKELEYLATHEYAHSIINALEKLPSNSRNFVGTDFSVYQNARKEIHAIFERYSKDIDKLQKIYDDVSKPVNERLLIDGIPPTEAEKKAINKVAQNLQNAKVSKYSLSSEDEFIAECFTDARIGVKPSEYSKEVYNVIVKYFGK